MFFQNERRFFSKSLVCVNQRGKEICQEEKCEVELIMKLGNYKMCLANASVYRSSKQFDSLLLIALAYVFFAILLWILRGITVEC